jgi:hypothetical protein
MLSMFRVGLVGAALCALAAAAQVAHAAGESCRRVDVSFTPQMRAGQQPMAAKSQIVIWVEDAAGNYIDTLFITEMTGTYGLGNRPGRYDFNSGPLWPYGRRTATFPVWAHKHGMSWHRLVFQDGNDDNLSHSMGQSSPDRKYCAPRLRQDPSWDAVTCASVGYTDKGRFQAGAKTELYPPRADLTPMPEDTADVATFDDENPFDAVSRATPDEGVEATTSWTLPETMGDGDYVLFVEVSKEFDHNTTYSDAAYPAPVGIPYSMYGEPYRGQPSVVYQVPFTIGVGDPVAYALDYIGYGDPDGSDGDIRPPDATISTGVPGSGAERLALAAGANPYRVKVQPRTEPDLAPPAMPADLVALDVTSQRAEIYWTAPGEDGNTGTAAFYDIRFMPGVMTAADFEGLPNLPGIPSPEVAGTQQSIPLPNLLFDTEYSVGIRAYDACRKPGELAIVTFRTAARAQGEVDACFIATAAYGSVLATDVAVLRRFRDYALRRTVLGQIVMQSYYTFGPTLSGVIAESDPLREAARELLGPIVERVRAANY